MSATSAEFEAEVSKRLEPTIREVRSLQSKNETLLGKVRELKETIATLKNHNIHSVQMMTEQKGQLERHNDSLTQQRARLTDQVRRLETQNDEKDDRINILLTEIENARVEVASLREDNELIRSQIYRADRAVGPIRGEEFYIQSFQELSGEFENWAVRNTRAGKQQVLIKADETSLLALIKELSVDGKATMQFLGSKNILREWYSGVRTRIVLVRHIVALFLYSQVFEPIVFGLPPDAAKVLHAIENNIFSQGLPRMCFKLTCQTSLLETL